MGWFEMTAAGATDRTFEELVEQFRDAGRPITILINGDFERDPPGGFNLATRVANLITHDQKRVWCDETPEQYDGEDDPETLILTVPPDYSYEDWQQVREKTHLNRAHDQNLVILSAKRDKAILDAVHVEMHHSLEYIRQVKFQPFENEHLFIELDGLGAGGDRA